MSADDVRISIIVATKDRYETLFDCIRGLLINYSGPATEIIVRDNSSRPLIDAFKAEFSRFPNVTYIVDPTPVSQSENYELAVAQARGRYVTMIGDDDGISWGLLELAAWMDRHDVDAVFPGFSVYLWPGVNTRLLPANETGSLCYEGHLQLPRLVDPATEREAVLSSGCTSLKCLPRLYYGLVRKRCLDELRERASSYFPGPSPDMANAYSLSYCVARYVVASLPLFIAGNSRKSNAGLGLRGRHVGEIEDIAFLPRDTAEQWNRDVPFFWSGQTIWCQSACAAARAMGASDEFDRKNAFSRLYATLLVFQPRFVGRVLTAFRHRYRASSVLRTTVQAICVMALVGQLWLARVGGFLYRRLWLPRRGSCQRRVSGLPTVSAAVRQVDSALHAMGFGQWLECSPVIAPAGAGWKHPTLQAQSKIQATDS